MKPDGLAPPTVIATPAQIIAAIRALRPELQRAVAQIVMELRDRASPRTVPLAGESEPTRRSIPVGRRHSA
jgi:hypothetical protein